MAGKRKGAPTPTNTYFFRILLSADRGMISAETLAELEVPAAPAIILGVRERTDKLVRALVLDDAAPFAPHTRCADELNEARWSQNISKTAAFLNRSNRFHTLFHLPKPLRQRSPGDDAALPETADRYGPWRRVAAATRGTPQPPPANPVPSLSWTCRPSKSGGNP